MAGENWHFNLNKNVCLFGLTQLLVTAHTVVWLGRKRMILSVFKFTLDSDESPFRDLF